eukprot:Skav208150  [mRNA]  locus=scaffold2891:37782:38154:+ [translate_table: standard]
MENMDPESGTEKPTASKAIDPDPQRVLCPPRIPFRQLLRLESYSYISIALIVAGNLVLFIYVLSTTPEV